MLLETTYFFSSWWEMLHVRFMLVTGCWWNSVRTTTIPIQTKCVFIYRIEQTVMNCWSFELNVCAQHTDALCCCRSLFSFFVVCACLTVMHTVWPLFAYVLKTVWTQWGVKSDQKWLKYQNIRKLWPVRLRIITQEQPQRMWEKKIRTAVAQQQKKTLDRHFKLVKRQSKSLPKIVYSFARSLSHSTCAVHSVLAMAKPWNQTDRCHENRCFTSYTDTHSETREQVHVVLEN